MPRIRRLKPRDRAQSYHLYNRIAGAPGFFPLQERQARQQFLDLLFFYSSIYLCDLVAFMVLGNHYHLIIRFAAFTVLPRQQLRELAARLYAGKLYKPYLFWGAKQWRRFNERLYDVSEFMRNLESGYAVWHNGAFGRRGRLWADRFKSNLLESWPAVRAAVLYVELNAVRAGLVSRPEDYRFGSARVRLGRGKGPAKGLLSLQELWNVAEAGRGVRMHYAHLYHRGGLRIENEDELIRALVRQEEADGYQVGIYRSQQRYFTDGGVLGDPEQVQAWQDLLHREGVYRKPREPVRTGSGSLSMLRPQRRPAWMNHTIAA